MNNSKPNSLGAIVDQHERKGRFLGNPFDAYESYTYNLELFVVDRTADRMFQLQEAFSILDIANNKWPSPNDNSVTIAKTGSTTEFNITDLTIEAVYKGTNNNSKLASTATKLNFVITQIGATSLPENLQNAVALCGYDDIFKATFYIKINFVGYDENGKQKTIENSTKVFAFNINQYLEFQTTSDARGTASTINGLIKQDESLTNKTLTKTKVGFSYVIGDTLKETLDNFMIALNESNLLANPNLTDNLQNTYSWDHSDQFEKYTKSPMKGEETSTNENMEKTVDLSVTTSTATANSNKEDALGGGYDAEKEAFVRNAMRTVNDININPGLGFYYSNNNNDYAHVPDLEKIRDDITLKTTKKDMLETIADNTKEKANMYQASAKEVGQVLAGMDIYEVIQNICISAVDVKKEITASKSGNTEVLKISPWLVIKENGYNPVAGTNVYNIEYYIDYVLKEVVQNKLDDIDKKRYSKTEVQQWFETGHVTKLYNYLYTGKNDQILDFDISLDKQLVKTYSKPTDSYAYQHFLNDGTPEGMFISENHKKLINEYDTELKELKGIADTSKEALNSATKSFYLNKDSFRKKIIKNLMNGNQSLGFQLQNGFDEFDGRTMEELLALEEERGRGELYTSDRENYDKLAKAVNAAQKDHRTASENESEEEKKRQQAITDAITSQLSKGRVGRQEASKEIFDSLKLNKGDNSRRNITLLEELDDDLISKLSNSDFEIILKNQANNPTSFETLIGKLDEVNGNYTLKSTAEEDIDLAREKYYESNRYDISMMQANMTIKGDPYWLEGVVSPKQAKKLFGNGGNTSSSGRQLNLSTTQNGNNGCVIISGKADGVDLNDNILVKNLITHLYMVTHVISSFSGGRFTQTLQMIRKINADAMVDTIDTVGPPVVEIGDSNEGETLNNIALLGKVDRKGDKVLLENKGGVNFYSDGTTEMNEILIDGNIPKGLAPPSQLPSNPFFKGSLADQYGQGVLVTQEMLDARELSEEEKKQANHWSNTSGPGSITGSMNHADAIRMNKLNAEKKAEEAKAAAVEAARISTMKKAMSAYRPRIGTFDPDMGPVGEEVKKMADEFVETADLAETLHAATEAGEPELPSGPIVRQANAAMYLNSLPGLTRSCRAEQKRGIMPFVSCDAIKAHNKKILSMFETTPGVTPTIAEINAHLNNNIADAHPKNAGEINESTESHMYTNYGEVTGADDGTGGVRRDRGLITENANATKYSDYEIAMFQIAAGGVLTVEGHDPEDIERMVREASLAKTPVTIIEDQANGDVSSDVSSEQGFGATLDNSILNGNEVLVNKASTPTYINVVIPPPMTEAEYEEKYKKIKADTTCTGQCRTRKLLLLGKEHNDAVKQQYYIDRKVEEIVEDAKVVKKININNRKLEVVSFAPESFTTTEHADRIVLSTEIGDILANNRLTSDEVIAKEATISAAVEILDADIKDNNLNISDGERNATVEAIVVKVSDEVALSALSDNDYRKIQGYETAINNIVVEANTGHRANLTTAVNVGITEDKLVALSESKAETKTKLNQYFWDTNDRRVWANQLEDTEVEIAEHMLGMPDENMTAVATVINGTTKTFIPIFNPVKEVVVGDQPVVIKNADEQFDVVLAGTDGKYADVTTQNNIDQLTQARNIYYQLTSTGAGDMKSLEDDMGTVISVKDFSNLSPITYTDASGTTQTIANPSTEFGLHTLDVNDMYPANKQDYQEIRQQVADLFPNVDVILANTTAAYLSVDGKGMVILNGTAFYINP